MKLLITGGVKLSEDSEDYIFDYRYNHPEDIIHIFNKKIYVSEIRGYVYYFGYEFNKDSSSKQRSDFIHYLKGIGDKKISDYQLKQFIEHPLNDLDKKVDMYSIDCFVYPISGRSPLVQRMIEVIGEYTSRDIHSVSYQLVKSAPTDIEFDWDMFEREIEVGTQRYNQMSQYINDVLMPAIKNLDYFSLAKNVKPKYRKYIKNFLNMKDDNLKKFNKLKGQKILIVDDINTSGSTLNEIVRILRKINNDCEIYIYTLIGNFK